MAHSASPASFTSHLCSHIATAFHPKRAPSACSYSYTSLLPQFSRVGLTSLELPKFAESSSPELSELLQTIRERILIPSFLNTRQRDLIFKEKWRTTVENEDITAEIGDEEVPLRHLEYRDIPKRKRAVLKAIELSESEEDWENVLRIFEGLHHSRTRDDSMSRAHAKFIRWAIDADMMHIAMKAVSNVATTGISFKDADVLKQLLIRGVHQRAMDKNWTPEATEEAFEQARSIIQMMEFPAHGGSKHVTDASDPRVQPWVMGVLLEATAMRQKVLFNGKDHEGLVSLYVQRLLDMGRTWPTEVSCSERFSLGGSSLQRY